MSKLQRIYRADVSPAHGVSRKITTAGGGCRRMARAFAGITGWAVLLSAGQPGIAKAASADLSVTLSSSQISELVYTAVVTNNGPGTPQHVVVTAQLPPGVVDVSVTPSSCAFQTGGMLQCDLGAIVPSASQTVVVTLHPITTGDKTAQVAVSSGFSDPSPSNNSASATETITAVGISDVMVAMSAPNPITLGGRLIYNVTIANLGDDDAQGVTFEDAVPATAQLLGATSSAGPCTIHPGAGTVTCPIGHLAVQGTATVRIAMIPNATGPFYNTVFATPTSVDPNLTNNAVTTVTWVNP